MPVFSLRQDTCPGNVVATRMNYFWHTFRDCGRGGRGTRDSTKPQQVKMEEDALLLQKKGIIGKIKKFHVSSSGGEEKEVTGSVVRMLLTQLDTGSIRTYYGGNSTSAQGHNKSAEIRSYW